MISTAPAERPDQRRAGGPLDYISPSRLNLWLRCPLAWKFRYLDGLRTPTTPALFLGQRCHAGLETYYRHRMLGVTLSADDIVGRMDASWDEAVAEEGMQFDSPAEETALKTQAGDLVRTYLQQVPADEPRPLAVEAAMEAPLVDPMTGEDLGIPLLGIADLVLPGEEGPVITDFKTSSRSAPPFEVTHEVQLTGYAWLYRQLTGQQEAGLEIRSLIKTKTPKVETHAYLPRTDDHFRRLFAVIREYIDALDASRFNYRPGWGCSMCDYRERECRAWSG
jgi:putative RecB family exonuclease